MEGTWFLNSGLLRDEQVSSSCSLSEVSVRASKPDQHRAEESCAVRGLLWNPRGSLEGSIEERQEEGREETAMWVTREISP